MTVWIILAAFAAAAAFFVRRRRRKPARQILLLTTRMQQFSKTPGRQSVAEAEALEQTYDLVETGMAARDAAMTYRAADVLKLAFGSGIFRSDEAVRLGALLSTAIKNGDMESSTRLLDAYELLLRRMPPQRLIQAIEGLGQISVLAYKGKAGYLVTKAAEISLGVLERRAEQENSPAVHEAALGALKLIGLFALRRGDDSLFREILARMGSWAVDSKWLSGDQVLDNTVYWLHKVINNNSAASFAEIAAMMDNLAANGRLEQTTAARMVTEWKNAAAHAALNPSPDLAATILQHLLALAAQYWDMRLWESAVNGTGETVRVAVDRRGPELAFPVFLPLLEQGRQFMVALLKLGPGVSPEGFREKALATAVRECLAIMESVARPDITATAGDIIVDCYRRWSNAQDVKNQRKSIQKFCQVLVIFWANTRKRQSRDGLPAAQDLLEPLLVSETDRHKLAFLNH